MSILSVLTVIVDGIEAATALVSATKRLERAAKATEPPKPPPPADDGYPEAVAYVRGRDDATRAREQQERAKAAFDEFARRAAMGDEGEAEKPTEGS